MSPILEKARKYLTSYQAQILVRRYEANPYPKREERHQLAQLLNISEERINNWFTQWRLRQRKKSGKLHDGE